MQRNKPVSDMCIGIIVADMCIGIMQDSEKNLSEATSTAADAVSKFLTLAAPVNAGAANLVQDLTGDTNAEKFWNFVNAYGVKK